MNLSENGEKIFCHVCNVWVSIEQDILLIEDKVFCLHCMEQGRDTMLGYEDEAFLETEDE
jgi:hypothetical protein